MPGGGNLKVNVLLPLLQVEGKVCILELWEISMEKVCFGMLRYNEKKKKKQIKILELSSVSYLFVPPLNKYRVSMLPSGVQVLKGHDFCFQGALQLKR